ncbi:voltage-gated chloride channel ClcB [Methylolobus aquaticus]|nr:voltage-gated chloride channel ClcB [Methylolobus aquaticus]
MLGSFPPEVAMTGSFDRLLLLARIRLGARFGRIPSHGMLVWAALIGMGGGLTSALFREANIGLKWLLTGQSGDIVAIAESLSPGMRLFIPTVGGIGAGIALAVGARLFRGMRAQEYLEVIRLGDGVILLRPTLARLVSSLLSISSGTSIGREGGMVQLSALMASTVGRLFRVSKPQLRLLVACGGAAGIASAYNAPLAGALFIAEIVLQSLAIEALGPLVVASVAATLTIRHWIGLRPIFTSPELAAPADVDVLPVLGLGLLAGLLAPALLGLLGAATRAFQCSRLPLPIRLGLGGFLVGLMSVNTPEIWGNGHAATTALLGGQLEADFVLHLLMLKVLATAIAVGSGAVGGVFTPTLLMGAAAGWLYGEGLHLALPGLATHAVTFAALGMGALLSGTTHAPLMAIVLVFEMTLDANLLFPLILAAMTARYVAAAIRPSSVYAHSLGTGQARLPYLLHVEDLQTRPVATVRDDVSAEQVREIFCRSAVQHVWVVDASGRYRGAIALHTMKRFLGHDDLRHIRAAAVFLEDDVPAMRSGAPLTDALAAFSRTGVERLPVVGANGVLLGEISKTDVLLSLA